MNGYIVCRHVFSGSKPASFVELPGVSHPTIGCITCDLPKEQHPQKSFRLVCQPCARKRGWENVPGKIPEGLPS